MDAAGIPGLPGGKRNSFWIKRSASFTFQREQGVLAIARHMLIHNVMVRPEFLLLF
jgi:hypothetical protein